ncbi:hypothetical protein Y1Q_0018859 [Alligator mississippiensis]|uniref:Uncharacterized protein n=1 Tax=Alligator mississippiensis TaxID=8496 RepID=A0A151M2Y3_ALLMI|nr:hypothetical protein Y1Q_0018859 [Alligator mississippiensis]
MDCAQQLQHPDRSHTANKDSIYNQILRKEEIDTMDLYVTKASGCRGETKGQQRCWVKDTTTQHQGTPDVLASPEAHEGSDAPCPVVGGSG